MNRQQNISKKILYLKFMENLVKDQKKIEMLISKKINQNNQSGDTKYSIKLQHEVRT